MQKFKFFYNFRDAKAQNLQIYTDIREEFRGSVLLNFLDDGVGMDPGTAFLFTPYIS